jgi:hypothetical protein
MASELKEGDKVRVHPEFYSFCKQHHNPFEPEDSCVPMMSWPTGVTNAKITKAIDCLRVTYGMIETVLKHETLTISEILRTDIKRVKIDGSDCVWSEYWFIPDNSVKYIENGIEYG